VNCSDTFFPASPGRPGALLRLLSQRSLLPSHGPPGTSLPSTSPSSRHLQAPSPGLASFPLCASGRLCPHPCSAAQGGWEGARPAPTRQQPTVSRNGGGGCRGVLGSTSGENSLGQARGLERGWPGQRLEAAAGGAGLVQANLSEE